MSNERIIRIKPGETVIIQSEGSIKEWLSISEFAKLNRMSRNTVYSHIEKGKIIVKKDQKGKVKINSNQLKF